MNKVFRFEYNRGFFEVNVPAFFISNNLNDAKKFFKFAKKHCGETQRYELIMLLESCIERMSLVIVSPEDLRKRRAELLEPFFGKMPIEKSKQEKELIKQKDKLTKVIQILKVQVWA